MKLYLHVGPHKTGTTLIQKTMLDNQGLLLQQGVFYPKNFVTIFGHHDFRNKIQDEAITDEDVLFLEHTEKNVLLSSEDFISLNEKNFRYLKQRLSNFDIEIIYSWRRGNKKMFSIWQEYVKHGGQDTFFEYHFPHLARPATSAMLSPDIKLQSFARVFGKNKVKIIDYDAAAEADNLLELFFSIIQVSDTKEFKIPLQDENASNKSLKYYESELLRALNTFFAVNKEISGSQVRIAFNEHRAKLDPDIINDLFELIKNDIIEVNADKYFIDQRSEKVMSDKFVGCIANYQENKLINSFTLSSQKWLLRSDAQMKIKQLAEELCEYLS